MKTAIVYGTGITKHTKKIAEYISKKSGAEIFDAKNLSSFSIDDYEKIVIGTNVHAGKPNGRVLKFATENKDKIAEKKPILFISCMYDGEKGEKQSAKISEMFGISDTVFYPGKLPKNEDGVPEKVDELIAKL